MPKMRLPLILGMPALWVALDFLKAHLGFLSLPWATLAHSQHENLALIQLASVTGEYGVTYIIVMVNTAIALALPVPTASPSAPLIKLNQTEFKALPAKVMIEVQAVRGLKIKYVLEKKINGRYKKVKKLRSPSFEVTEPGYYRVRASFDDGRREAVDSFKVLVPKAPVLKLKKIKAKKQFRTESRRRL